VRKRPCLLLCRRYGLARSTRRTVGFPSISIRSTRRTVGFPSIRSTRRTVGFPSIPFSLSLVRLQDPERFAAIYRGTAQALVEPCSSLLQICLSAQGASFALTCGEGLELALPFDIEGGASLSVTARPGEVELTVAK
jgi:hypothetical protein